ncbi:transposase [Microvirga sp. 2YAF29]|uniref:transposase n=1 Tax=Microvirga sp. 2YAF29 TaxID=3233031 RepID=UPI003F9DEF7D
MARVDELGKQRRIELTDGRRAHLFPGDEIVVCFGNRYAPDQFEGLIGEDLSSCDLVAAGGIASCEVTRNEKMIPSTRISPIGLITDAEGNRLNLKNFAVNAPAPANPIKVILSLGTSMNAGKTFTSTSMVRGFKGAGYRVAAIKATGTGAGNDLWIVRDAGADVVLDFTDGGLASTYLIPLEDIVASTRRLIYSAAQQGCEVAVVEVADGLQHLETADVIQADGLWTDCVGVIFAAYDSMGAKCGVDMLKAAGHNVLAISGRLTQSPLMMRETQRSTGLPVFTPWEIQDGALTSMVMNPAGISPKAEFDHHHIEILRGNDLMLNGPAKVKVHVNGDTSAMVKTNGETSARELLKTLAEKFMTIEISTLCGAGVRERGPSRVNRRNGYRRQHWETGVGRIEINVPRVRKGGYHPIFLRSNGVSAEEMMQLVSQAAEWDATPLDLERLLERLGMPQIPSQTISNLSIEVKQKAQQIGLQSLRGNSPLLAGLRAISNRRSIKEEYGLIPGYGDDHDEMDPFVRVETLPIGRARGTSGVG